MTIIHNHLVLSYLCFFIYALNLKLVAFTHLYVFPAYFYKKNIMKSNLLFLLFCLTASIASAQFTFLDIDNNPVESGATVTFGQGQVGDPDGFYSYFVANDASEAIFMKAELFSAENTDGSFFEICFGLCYDEITIGQKFPNNGAVFIDQGGQTLPGNHLGNTLADDVPRTFTFRYYQTDQAGTTELGNDFFITYSYDPTLGVDNNILIDFNITATLVDDAINFNSSEYLMLELYDKRGRRLKKHKINPDTNRMPIDDLPSGIYFLSITNDMQISKTIKIVKK
tara:strand:- start:7665 stop:8513 length:849 start_codon:yes stop_codon:yes gene_type:complete